MKSFPRGMQVSRAEIAARVLAEQEQKAAEERKKKKAIKSSGGDDYVGEITANLNKEDSLNASSVDGAISMLSAAAVGESSPSSKCAPGHRIQQMIQPRRELGRERAPPSSAGSRRTCALRTLRSPSGNCRGSKRRDAPEKPSRCARDSSASECDNGCGESSRRIPRRFFAGEPEPQGVAVHGAAVKAVGQVAG